MSKPETIKMIMCQILDNELFSLKENGVGYGDGDGGG